MLQLLKVMLQVSNGLIRMLRSHWPNIRNIIIISITIKREILEITESMRKFTDLPLLIRASFHNHGEELRLLIQLMDSRTHHSIGSINQRRRRLWLKKINITEILVTTELMRKFMDLLQLIRASSHNHGEE